MYKLKAPISPRYFIRADSISSGDIRTFRSYFAPSYSHAPSVQEIDEKGELCSWVHYKNGSFLGDNDIRAHLAGHIYFGTPLPKAFTKNPIRYTATIAIDIDCSDEIPLTSRFQEVQRAMEPATPIPFRSPSGGLHVYFILEKTSYLSWAIEEARKRLESVGLSLMDGNIEIMERNSNRRLPLGKNCPLLYRNTLEPVNTDNVYGFYILLETLRGNKLNRLHIPALKRQDDPNFAEYYRDIRPAKAKRNRYRQNREESTKITKAKQWLSSGLSERGERRGAQLDLVRYFMGTLSYTANEAYTHICAWLDENHNDVSKSYRESRETCYRDIRHLCNNWDNSKWTDKLISKKVRERLADNEEGDAKEEAPIDENWILEVTSGKVVQGKILNLVGNLAWSYGKKMKNGRYKVEVASSLLKECHTQYSVHLQILQNKGYLKLERNHFNPPSKRMRGRAKTYSISPSIFKY